MNKIREEASWTGKEVGPGQAWVHLAGNSHENLLMALYCQGAVSVPLSPSQSCETQSDLGQKVLHVAGEMAGQLTLSALPEDQDLIPSTHIR